MVNRLKLTLVGQIYIAHTGLEWMHAPELWKLVVETYHLIWCMCV